MKLPGFFFYCSLLSWVRVALLLCVLAVTLRLLPVLYGLGVPPTRSAADEPQNAPGAPPLPLDKGKGRVNLVKYHEGSEYLKSAVQHAVTVGPSKVGPSYGVTFSKRYRLPSVSEYGPLTS